MKTFKERLEWRMLAFAREENLAEAITPEQLRAAMAGARAALELEADELGFDSQMYQADKAEYGILCSVVKRLRTRAKELSDV